MEERMVDPETERLLKELEENLKGTLGEDDYDEELVGLTPEQLDEKVKELKDLYRERQETAERLVAEGNELLAKGEFEAAEERFSSAFNFDEQNMEALEGVMRARTCNRNDPDRLLEEDIAVRISQTDGLRDIVLDSFGIYFTGKREELLKEESELAAEVESAKEERGQKFSANRSYYLRRFAGFWAAFVLCMIGLGVSAGFVYRVNNSVPVICVAVFGAVAFVMLVLSVLFTRKLLVAHRLCRANDDLRSTEKGSRLADIREELSSLALILGQKDGTSSEDGAEA